MPARATRTAHGRYDAPMQVTGGDPTYDGALRAAAARVGAVDARWLLLHVAQRDAAWLVAHGRDPLPAPAAAEFAALVERRAAGEPVAYLTGTRGFRDFELDVDPRVLIPRPETELLVELALERIPPGVACSVADLGTGSGAIALALARERPQTQVMAVDASTDALALASHNAARLSLRNVAFVHGDWFSPLAGQRFDLVASNPPYIAHGDPHLAQGDLRYEPAMALASGVDGLDAIRGIVRHAPAHLEPRGWLLLEHGWQQGAQVRVLMQQAGLVDVGTQCDLEGRERVSLGRMPG